MIWRLVRVRAPSPPYPRSASHVHATPLSASVVTLGAQHHAWHESSTCNILCALHFRWLYAFVLRNGAGRQTAHGTLQTAEAEPPAQLACE